MRAAVRIVQLAKIKPVDILISRVAIDNQVKIEGAMLEL